MPEAKNQGFEALLEKVYAQGEAVSGYGLPVNLLRNGKIENVYVSFVYQPFREGDGSVSGILVVLTEVTEQIIARQKMEANDLELQRRVEERTVELENINTELKRSNANLEEFAYAASHDLKEPVRKILVFFGSAKE